ncbi:copper transporter [Nocardiopsis sp. MG754419]|uniref:copper transporter n=1 Tax=Nocardiopsis sp. MG754419 TaxID=2259865 RepID=UPI001BAB24B8|nr:copper transporter [Nocardiopsis sp. MG754419]MBR8742754.1 copper transporter [Nocardiopsis sp. MG754419]
MIDFRYHLVSIVAVFLALTVGLVLGTTMLQDPLLNTLQSETADLRGQSEDLRVERDEAELLNNGADQLVEASAGDVLTDRLHDVDLVVVAAPGADEDVVRALGTRAEDAGARIAGQVSVEDAFLDTGGSTFVDELALQVSDTPGDLTGGPYTKAGTELGRALASDEIPEDEDARDEEDTDREDEAEDGEGADGGHDAGAVLAAFAEGGLITLHGSPAGSADALLVVAPDGPIEGDVETVTTALNELTGAMSRQAEATVLTGGVESGREGGLLHRALAEEPAFSTVDVAGRPAGDVVVMLSLAESLEGGRGAYGVGEGTSGFLPDPLPEPRIDPEEDPEVDADAASDDRDEARRAGSGNGE